MGVASGSNLIQKGPSDADEKVVECRRSETGSGSCCFEIADVGVVQPVDSLLSGVSAAESLPQDPTYVRDEGSSGSWQFWTNDVEDPTATPLQKCEPRCDECFRVTNKSWLLGATSSHGRVQRTVDHPQRQR